MNIKKTDHLGRRIDCHFFSTRTREPQCSALVDFYNACDGYDLCKGCPFFKTDEEFRKGWENRNDSQKLRFTTII